MDDLVAVARVVRPKGLKGEVFAEVLTDYPERFDGLKNAIAVLPNGQRLKLKIEEQSFQNDRLVLKFAEYDSLGSIEPLRGAEICVPQSDAVKLEEGEFFDWQLEGCRVETVGGETIGRVRELQRTGGTENLVVDGNGRDYLIPFAESICVDVDVEEKLIKVDLPEGLLEF